MNFTKFLNRLNEEEQNVVSQQDVLRMVKIAKKQKFIKNAVVAVVKTSELTDEQKNQIGSVDRATYSKEYFEQNPYVLIQAKKDGSIDMYNPSESVIQNNYREVNPSDQILSALQSAGISKNIVNKFVVKTVPTMMAKASSLGLENKTIEAPWGGTQEAQKDSYIVDGGTEAYVVNPDNSGLPIGYIKA